MKTIYSFLDRQNKYVLLGAGLVAVGIIGILDYHATWQINLSILYVFVLTIFAYHGGWVVGSVIAVASVVCWSAVEILTGLPYVHWVLPYWNAVMRLAMFLLFCFGLSFLRKQVELVENLARIDPLTGVLNRRCFRELAAVEMERARRYRHAFTVVYIDLDGFKGVNDEFGHDVGDHVLLVVAQTVRSNLRGTDFLARLGGDEFVVVLTETGREAAAQYLLKLRDQLLQAMQASGWKVTFSIGAMTYIGLPASIDEMISGADNLMYHVKQEGKNGIKHEVQTP